MSEQQNYSLSDLMSELQMVIRSSFDQTYFVIAELANVSSAPQGHMYLELVEKSEQQIIAKARANLWNSRRHQIITAFEDVTKETLKAGMKVLLQLSVDFHPVYGLSFQVLDIDPSYSLGEMERQKQETIKRLEEEGLLDFNKQYVLSAAFKDIAIISSETAAGYQDFINQLENNSYGYQFNVQLFTAIMQGEHAPKSIISALDKLEAKEYFYDAIVVIRGGGSNLDLACFDDYELNARLAQSFFPVFSGIGHERDFSVTDMVAHTRLKTPTAVADHIIQYNFDFENNIKNLFSSILASAQDSLAEQNYQVERCSDKIVNSSKEMIKSQENNIKELSFVANHSSLEMIYQNNSQIINYKSDILYLSRSVFNEKAQVLKGERKSLIVGLVELLEKRKEKLVQVNQLAFKTSLFIDKEIYRMDYIKQLINISNPENLLKRGFSITRQNGKVISDPGQIDIGKEMAIQLAGGIIKTKMIK